MVSVAAFSLSWLVLLIRSVVTYFFSAFRLMTATLFSARPLPRTSKLSKSQPCLPYTARGIQEAHRWSTNYLKNLRSFLGFDLVGNAFTCKEDRLTSVSMNN
ncbi:hypothetical protein TIFTF001_019104 [Ficus carica]|uniref:Uncharacterized protein n=1 Tax=Ficus carica TaxID=3494 RepID=A0AA88AFG2_FICCA|nr:hypothetical protein TIFTF001_019104 [Ficus carica]